MSYYVVTGGAGFIGSHIVDALSEEPGAIAVLDNLSSGRRDNLATGIRLAVGDVRDSAAVAKALPKGTDTVFHLAAQTDVRKAVTDPGLDAQVNIGGTINVLNACIQMGVRSFVMSSTGGALYGRSAGLPALEDAPIEPLSPYGVSKYCAEQYVAYVHRVLGLPSVILRYANVYGPRQDSKGEAGVIGIFVRHILLGQPCIVFGDGEQTRDFIFVDDVVKANMLAMKRASGTYNIGTGTETSINGLLATLECLVGHPIARKYVSSRAGEVGRIALNADRARCELGWRPSVSLEEGLTKTLAWVDRQL